MKKGNSIVGYIAALLFLGGFFGAIILGSMGEIPYCIACIGVVVTVLGILIAAGDLSLRKLYLWVAPILGLMMIIAPLYYTQYILKHAEIDAPSIERIVIIAAIFIFGLSGIALVYASVSEKIYIKKCCTQRVIAKCISLDEKLFNSVKGVSATPVRKPRVYAPTWEYEWNGKQYTYIAKDYSNVNVPSVGESYELFINPSKPEEPFEQVSSVRIGCFVMGILCIMSAILIVILM